jgi:uncharacterized protein (UPF0264 family)
MCFLGYDSPRDCAHDDGLSRLCGDNLSNHSSFFRPRPQFGEAMTQLLVSVRNATEAEAALRGGAQLIDVKEPVNGPLGKASDAAIENVVRAVSGRVCVSAALGEISVGDELPSVRAIAGLAYVKVGLAGLGGGLWQERVASLLPGIARRYPDAVAVAAAYADWRLAGAPSVNDVCEFAVEQGRGVLLIDTFAKAARQSLLNWLSAPEICRLSDRCRSAGVKVALAGSLSPEQIDKLLPLRPDWIAVRGAACDGGREGVVSEQKVRLLAELIRGRDCGS